MDRFSLILVIIGAIIWGTVGIFGINPVTWITQGSITGISRSIYTLIGLGGLWCIKLLFRERILVKRHE